jgi:hypothetical protein
MKIYEGEKQQKLDAVQARLAQHEKITRIVLVVMVILAGLALVVLAHHLFDLLPPSNK